MNDQSTNHIEKDDSSKVHKTTNSLITQPTSLGKSGLLFALFLFLQPAGIFAQQAEEDAASPFEVSVSYTGDLFGNVAGGNETGIRYFDNIDVNMQVNFDELPLGLSGTTFYVYGIGNQGGSISGLAGDLQGISNIEAENSWRIFEIWVQKKFFLANSSILLGLYDINSEFNVLNSSLLFLNSSHGLDPTIALSGVLGPSTFPYTSLAARLKINPFSGLYMQAAVLDGVPSDPGNTRGTKIYLRERDGVFVIGEIGFQSLRDNSLQMRNRVTRLQNMLDPGVVGNNKIAIGGWFYSNEKSTWEVTGFKEQEFGFYALGEYEIFSNTSTSPRSLRTFFRAGAVNPDINMLNGFLGGGFVFDGLIPGRPGDQTGLAVAHAMASPEYRSVTYLNSYKPEKAETNIEFTHQFALNDYVQVQGNAQYVLNPGLDATLDDAVVVGARLVIGF